MGQVLDRIMQHADEIRAEGVEGDKLMRLTDTTAKRLRDSGIIRTFQPKEYGGFEGHPREAAETIMRSVHSTARDGLGRRHRRRSSVGARLLRPQGPGGDLGRGQRHVDGLAVRTDGCRGARRRRIHPQRPLVVLVRHRPLRWIMIGAAVGDKDGNRTGKVLHVVLPRSDYEIDQDSWNVIGLRGTGSKDLIIKDAFIPEHRTLDADIVLSGNGWRHAGRDETLYKFPFSYIFPLGITASLIGMTEGALACYVAAQKERVQVSGIPIKEDPYVLFAISEAAAEISASRLALLETVDRFWDKTDRGEEISFEERAIGRRTQISAAWRAVRAMDEIFARAGGAAVHLKTPMQRFWRDAHVGLTHAIHVPGLIYHSAALTQLGGDPQSLPRMI